MSVFFGKFFWFSVFLIDYGGARWSRRKLQMEVHFEWLCTDSEKFIGNLSEHWHTIGPYLDINFVPFGKATSLRNGRFVCQHGPLECTGNRFMSCALVRIPDKSAQVKFVNCFMSKGTKSAAQVPYSIASDVGIYQCSAEVGLDFNDTLSCFESEEGTKLQLQAEFITKRNRKLPDFVPTIIYDNRFDQNLQDNSILDVRGTVCHLLQQNAIANCHDGEGTSMMPTPTLGFFKK